MISIFRFLWNLHSVFQVNMPTYKGYNSELLPNNSVGWFPFFFLQPLQHLLFVDFNNGHSDQYAMYLIIVFTCISIIISNVEHLFTCLLLTCISSLEKCLFKFSAHFSTGFLFSWLLSSMLLLSCSGVSNYLWPCGWQHTWLPCPSPSPRAFSNSCPLSRWCQPTISTSITPFSSSLQSFPATGSFLMSQLFPSGGQNVEL